jgi:DNA-binding MarR family transcriptional regulator
MKNDQIANIEEMLMTIPTKMCRNMDQRFVNIIIKDISKDIAKHHFMILKMLQEKEQFYVTEIVQVLGITKSQMTSSVDKLLKLGYVERWADTKDRRKVFVALTKNGSEITEKINSQINELFHNSIKKLSQEELNDFEKGLIVLNKFCSLGEQ